jgi:hypothetical protein
MEAAARSCSAPTSCIAASPAARGGAEADGMVASVNSNASNALTATTIIGALNGRSLCSAADRCTRTMSFTLPEAIAATGPGQTKAQRRLIPGLGDESPGEALRQQLLMFSHPLPLSN